MCGFTITDPAIYFCHITKTAGTSLKLAFQETYGNQYTSKGWNINGLRVKTTHHASAYTDMN